MEFTGKFKGIQTDYLTGEAVILFTVNEKVALAGVDKIKDIERLRIKAVQYREKRSLDANGLLWACLSDIAAALRADKWDIYLQMLKRYGQYTYICVKPKMVEAVKMQWRECEVVGNVNINGQEAVQMLVYFGSSTYNTQEFSVLLDGVVSEMKEMGLPLPMPGDMKMALEQWE
jgi:sensor domain CHASE-containing protein